MPSDENSTVESYVDGTVHLLSSYILPFLPKIAILLSVAVDRSTGFFLSRFHPWHPPSPSLWWAGHGNGSSAEGGEEVYGVVVHVSAR
jgi:hypothetical protein